MAENPEDLIVTDAELRRQLPVLADELGIVAGVPIFETLAEAEAWEAAHPGKRALTLESSEPDTTAPTWNATLTVGTPTDTQVVVTASALATDDRAVAGYEVTYNGSTWSGISPSGSAFTLAGTPGTAYTATKLRARDAAGNRSTPLTVPSYTMAAAPVVPWLPAGATVITSDKFTGDSTTLASRPSDAGWGGTPMSPTLTVADAYATAGGTLRLQKTGRLIFDVGATTRSGIYVGARLVEELGGTQGAVTAFLRAGCSTSGAGPQVGMNTSSKVGDEFGVLARPDGTWTTYVNGVQTGAGTTAMSGGYVGFIAANTNAGAFDDLVIAEVPA